MKPNAPGICPGRFALISQFMKNRPPVFEGTDVPENVFQNLTGAERILPHPVAAVGVGADGDDLAPQLPEAPENVGGGKKIAAAVNAAGIHFQPLALFGQNPENFVDDLPVGNIGQGRVCGVTGGLADISYFNCSNYNSGRGSCTSTHYIRVDFLEQVVLGEIKRLTKYAVHYEDEFQQAIMGSTQKAVELERKLKQKELVAAQARDGELDGLFERIYEDNLSGKLSDERFSKMSQRYEEEQAELSEKIKALRKELDKLSGDSVSTDMFLATVRKYTRAKKLTPRMLNELVNHIEVHQAEKINGEWVQKLTIYYNCVGALFIPDTPSMPVPDVTVNTRRGVYVSYEPAQNGQ